MICTKFRYAHTERRIRVSTSPLSVWWWQWWWLTDDGWMKDFKLFHQGISHWVQYSRVGWGSQNQEWTWHPSKQIGRRWAQDHTENIIGLCYLHWNLFWLNLSLHLVHLVLKLSASVGKQQPGWQNFFALWIKMHIQSYQDQISMRILYTWMNSPLSGTFYDFSPYGLGKTPDCPVTNDWTRFMRHRLKQNIAFFWCSRMRKVKHKQIWPGCRLVQFVQPWICQIWLENLYKLVATKLSNV